MLVVQFEHGGKLRLQGDEQLVREFLERCGRHGIHVAVDYDSLCG